MYERLYHLFEDVTPLKTDCGSLCGAACCKGDDRTGMLLFPHEETALRVIESEGRRYAVCEGRCERKDRPLSCRIFPFFPLINDDGKVSFQIDIRGNAICPLIRNCDSVIFDTRFLRHIAVAGKILSKDAECLEFLQEIISEISEISAINNALSCK